MKAQWNAILESKRRERARLAALPFAEKIVLLEKLRDRAWTLSKSDLRAKGTVRETTGRYRS